MDERKQSNDSPSRGYPNTFKQHYAGTFVAKRIREQENSIYPSDRPDHQPREGILPMELKRMIEWLHDPSNHTTVTTGCAIGGLFVAAIYTLFAMFQWYSMQGQLSEMRKANEITRKQLVGTESAIVVFNTNSPATEPYPIRDRTFDINAAFRNDGHVIANGVKIHIAVQVLQIADNVRVGKQWTCDKTIAALPPSSPNRPADYLQCFIDEISNEDFRNILDRKSTLAIEGSYVYDNGFGESITQPFCFRYLHPVNTKKYGMDATNRLMECDDFPRWFTLWGQHVAEDQH
jgi:hypothetical protein